MNPPEFVWVSAYNTEGCSVHDVVRVTAKRLYVDHNSTSRRHLFGITDVERTFVVDRAALEQGGRVSVRAHQYSVQLRVTPIETMAWHLYEQDYNERRNGAYIDMEERLLGCHRRAIPLGDLMAWRQVNQDRVNAALSSDQPEWRDEFSPAALKREIERRLAEEGVAA